ncbi:hypothetical protein LSUB1_G003595 [Lachnellula subtilissima]|uniref:Uncharacterized protein n=1 Tax=Lachnellula subtilissima TaxID=602034 RepID=A0A8H8RSS0_9HELO|nr:hypothetical protein LSUB1_G003595 [Lachnellula subtilissima]
MSQPLTRSAIESVISKYGPVLQIHPYETYNLCSVDWFLSHCSLIDSENPSNNIVHPTQARLPHAPKEGTRYYLNIEEAVKPGDFPAAKAYVNAFWVPGQTYTDLQFWFFNAYNGHGTALFSSLLLNKPAHTGTIDLSPLGEHVGDWEYAAIRIDNRTQDMIGIMLSAHGKNIFYNKMSVEKEFKLIHGTQPSKKNDSTSETSVMVALYRPNYTEHRRILGTPVGLDFNLLNSTADGGKSLNCSQNYQLVNAPWLKEVVSPAWVGYPYRWGPEGTAIHMDAKTLGNFLIAALGEKQADPLLDTRAVLAASWLLHVFVTADINGAGAPSGQGPWSGHY